MKVTKVTSIPVRTGSFGGFYVRVDTDAGIYGLGEGLMILAGQAIEKAVDHLSELVVGEDPFSTERLWQHMFRRGFFPAQGVYACAVSAIDIALWDIKGKALGLPVHVLLGGPVRDKVVCYPHCQAPSTDELVANCVDHVERGWKFVRWGQPDNDGRHGATAGVLDPSRSVAVAEGRWPASGRPSGPTSTSPSTCTRGSTWPTPPPSAAGLSATTPSSSRTRCARRTGKLSHSRPPGKRPIAAGEQWSNKWQFREVIEEETISYARIDLCGVGGITEGAKITHWAETHYIDIAPHNPLGPVSAAAGVALCMASSTWACWRCRGHPAPQTPTSSPCRSASTTATPSAMADGSRRRYRHGGCRGEGVGANGLLPLPDPQRRRPHKLVACRVTSIYIALRRLL